MPAPALTLGTVPSQGAEHHKAAMWALWHGRRLSEQQLTATGSYSDGFTLLDRLSASLDRSEAPTEIDLWHHDGQTARGSAFHTWRRALQTAPPIT